MSAETRPLFEFPCQVHDLKIAELRKDSDDHEERLRVTEEAVTQFKFLLYLTAGGGLLSMFNLIAVIYLIVGK